MKIMNLNENLIKTDETVNFDHYHHHHHQHQHHHHQHYQFCYRHQKQSQQQLEFQKNYQQKIFNENNKIFDNYKINQVICKYNWMLKFVNMMTMLSLIITTIRIKFLNNLNKNFTYKNYFKNIIKSNLKFLLKLIKNFNMDYKLIKRPIILTILIMCTFTSLCIADVEAKPVNDEATTSFSKSNFNDDFNSITKINSNNDNNINIENNKGILPNNGSNDNTKSSSKITDLGFIHAFIASISVILVSELGDKTFFIAAIMAMRHPRLTVFSGAIFALALMTTLSAVFGMAATIIPRVYTYYISTALFAIFGLKMLKEGYYMSPTNAQEELEEVQSDLRKREDELEKEVSSQLVLESGSGVLRKSKQRSAAYLASRIFMQAFTMTFLAEWGDRSQLTTIILSAREDVYGVIVGGVLGHSMCTGLAVIGGRIIAQKISVRTVTLVGGVVFLLFAISALFFNPNAEP